MASVAFYDNGLDISILVLNTMNHRTIRNFIPQKRCSSRQTVSYVVVVAPCAALRKSNTDVLVVCGAYIYILTRLGETHYYMS